MKLTAVGCAPAQFRGYAEPVLFASVQGQLQEVCTSRALMWSGFLPARERQNCKVVCAWDLRFLIQSLWATIEFPFNLMEFQSNVDDTTVISDIASV